MAKTPGLPLRMRRQARWSEPPTCAPAPVGREASTKSEYSGSLAVPSNALRSASPATTPLPGVGHLSRLFSPPKSTGTSAVRQNFNQHLADDPSRPAALLLGYIRQVCALVARLAGRAPRPPTDGRSSGGRH